MNAPLSPLTYPARPKNGGPLPTAPPKLGAFDYEPKVNGWRAEVHAPSRLMWNRHGQPLTIADEFKAALDRLEELAAVTAIEWWDVEALERRHNIGRGGLIVLDWIPAHPAFQPPWSSRNQFLHQHLPEFDLVFDPANFPLLSIPPLVYGDVSVWRDLQQINWRLGCDFFEGLVAKRRDSLYPIQLRSPDEEFSGWIKHRFV